MKRATMKRRRAAGDRRPRHLAARMLAGVLAATCLSAVTLATPAAADTSWTDDQAATAASVWLSHQLVDGTFANPLAAGRNDYGLMIDALLAMYASGDGYLAKPIVERLDDKAEARDYFTNHAFMSTPDYKQYNYGLDDRTAGAVAKTLVAAEVAGRDPRHFGGYDMVEETKKTIIQDGSEKGRLHDYGPINGSYNNANTFGQALAVLGLAGVGENDDSAIKMLTFQQCSEGYFRIFYSFNATTNEDESCDAGKADGNSEPDRDSTGLGLSALIAARNAGANGLDDAIARASVWLDGQQTADGGWGGGVSTEAPNTNSTGLIVQGLASKNPFDPHVATGTAWLRSLQASPDRDSRNGLKDDLGAMAYNPDGYAAAQSGDGVAGSDTWIRATAQAALGVSRTSMWDLVTDRVAQHQPPATPAPTPSTSSAPSTPAPPGLHDRPVTTGAHPSSNSSGQVKTPLLPKAVNQATANTTTNTTASRTRVVTQVRHIVVTVPGPAARPGTRTIVVKPAPSQVQTVVGGSATPAGRLAHYIASQMVNGDHVEVTQGGKKFTDYDATADAVLALRSLGEQPATVIKASAFLAQPGSVAAYAHGAPYEKTPAAYAEPLAKLTLIETMAKRDGAAGPDAARGLAQWTSELKSLETAEGTFQDRGQFGDQSGSVERQSLASMALASTGATFEADEALSALMHTQCSAGGFPDAMGGGTCSTGASVGTGWAAQAVAVEPKAANGANAATPLPADQTALVQKLRDVLPPMANSDGMVTAGKQFDLSATSALAAGRQAVGLDASMTARSLVTLQRPDGGISTNARTSSLSESLAAAEGFAGGSWVVRPSSPLAPAPLTAPQSSAAPRQVVTEQHWWLRWWAIVGGLALFAAVGAMVGRRFFGLRRSGRQTGTNGGAPSDEPAANTETTVPDSTNHTHTEGH